NDNSDTAVLFCSTSSRKDTEDTQYAAETDVLEGIQGTVLSDDEYESEGEDIEYFGKLFKSPEPSVGQNVKRSSRKSSMPSKYSDYVLNKNVKYGIAKRRWFVVWSRCGGVAVAVGCGVGSGEMSDGGGGVRGGSGCGSGVGGVDGGGCSSSGGGSGGRRRVVASDILDRRESHASRNYEAFAAP
nr:ribonuclease H-like domain-containing protein [Tanacetum cinerariifolium]